MALSKNTKLVILMAIPLITFLLPAPDGLSLIAWRLLGVYIATIVGLVLKPYGEPVILLAAIAVSGVIIGNTEGRKNWLSRQYVWMVINLAQHGLFLPHSL